MDFSRGRRIGFNWLQHRRVGSMPVPGMKLTALIKLLPSDEQANSLLRTSGVLAEADASLRPKVAPDDPALKPLRRAATSPRSFVGGS
jgi:hypothetical protein